MDVLSIFAIKFALRHFSCLWFLSYLKVYFCICEWILRVENQIAWIELNKGNIQQITQF